MTTKQRGKPLPTLKDLVTKDLGYCCIWVFFQRFKQTAVIARRLGLSDRIVRKWKAECKSGEEGCLNSTCCMREKLLKK